VRASGSSDVFVGWSLTLHLLLFDAVRELKACIARAIGDDAPSSTHKLASSGVQRSSSVCVTSERGVRFRIDLPKEHRCGFKHGIFV
jgi:hypothetical protein